MTITEILKYTPNYHGEHGVDSTLHCLLKNTNFSKEVFSNLPGGSWTEFTIEDFKNKMVYKWDHIPRVTTSKRPDAVFQQITNDFLSFLLIESKKSIFELEENIGIRLKEYIGFNGGLFSKPCWQMLKKQDWEVIGEQDQTREWIKRTTREAILLYACFAYGLTPEIQDYSSEMIEIERTKQKRILDTNSDIDLVIGIFWTPIDRFPILIFSSSESFSNSSFGHLIEKHIQEYNDYQLSNIDS